MKKRFLIIWLAILGICVLAGIMTRLSYTNFTVDKIDKIDEFLCCNTFFRTQDVDFSSIEHLFDSSDLIARVRKTGVSSHQRMTVLSEVKVIDVIAGDEKYQGEIIYVYEPSYFIFNSELYYVFLGYILMQDEEEYILFLQKKASSNLSAKIEMEKNSFVITTKSALGKFKVGGSHQDTILDENLSYTYGQIRHLELLVSDKKELEFYLSVKNQVLERIASHLQ